MYLYRLLIRKTVSYYHNFFFFYSIYCIIFIQISLSMIKCDLKNVCAVISRAASVKSGKDGNSFLSFSVKLPVEGRDGSKKDLELSVSVDGDKSNTSVYSAGRRVSLTGVMTVRKKDGKVYYNFRADRASIVNSKDSDIIEGMMEFRGKIGKKGVDVKTDKKGDVYKAFSAFSTDKDGDKAEFTWVRFLYFSPKDGEDFLQADSYVEVKGDLQLGVFKDEISLDCRVSEVAPWVLDKK